jgi:hypothetical protein
MEEGDVSDHEVASALGLGTMVVLLASQALMVSSLKTVRSNPGSYAVIMLTGAGNA